MAAEVIVQSFDPTHLLSTINTDHNDFLSGTYTHTNTLVSPNRSIDHSNPIQNQQYSHNTLQLSGTQQIGTTNNHSKATSMNQSRLYKQLNNSLLRANKLANDNTLNQQKYRNQQSKRLHHDKMKTIALQQQLIQHNNQLSYNRVYYDELHNDLQQHTHSTVQHRRHIDHEIRQHKLNHYHTLKQQAINAVDQQHAAAMLERPVSVDETELIRQHAAQYRIDTQQAKSANHLAISFAQCQNTINRQLKNDLIKQHKKLQSAAIKQQTEQIRAQLIDTRQQYEYNQLQQYKHKQYTALDQKYSIQQQLALQQIKKQHNITQLKQKQSYHRSLHDVIQQSIQPLHIDTVEQLNVNDVKQILHNSDLVNQYINNSIDNNRVAIDPNDTELLSDFELEQQIYLLKQLAIQVKQQYTQQSDAVT